jgi:hypothetical protein
LRISRASARTFGLIVAVELAGPLQPGEDGTDDAGIGALGDLVDETTN